MNQETIQKPDNNNICCPELTIVPCADTKEHCHLLCKYSKTPVSNKMVRELCIGENFKHCINMETEIK